MIIQCKSGAQIVIGECSWASRGRGGVYLSVGNQRGSQGVILNERELAQVRDELGRIGRMIAGRQTAKQQRKVA